jgi:thioredoxin reductase (NADPH)
MPVVLVIDKDPDGLAHLERELQDRYARHYHLLCLRSAGEAREELERLAAAGDEVALVLAAQWLEGTTGSKLLDEVRHLHPRARRGLLIDFAEWGEKAMGDAIFEGIADGRFDQFVVRPSLSPDESFHLSISGLLLDWAEANRAAPYAVHIVAESWTSRSLEIREALEQCAVVHKFCLADSDKGRELMASARADAELPLIVLPNGKILENPTNVEVAKATGGWVNVEPVEFDVIIIGAGPAGLSAAVYGASEGFRTLVVDKGGIGGQATSSSLIRNYLGFSRGISGRQLAQNAYSQAWVFGAEFAFMQSITNLFRDGRHLVVALDDGSIVRTAAVLLAMGVSYRRLGVPDLEALSGAGVYYGGSTSEAPMLADRDVVIVGGANSAGQAALHLARYARTIKLVVRADSLRASMSEYLVRQVEATDNIEVLLQTQVVGGGGDGRLERLVLRGGPAQSERTVEAQALFLMIGAQPNTGWLPPEIERDNQGFIMTGSDISPARVSGFDQAPFHLETSMPGVFAAGDVRHGSVKRVASAVGEGSIVIQMLHEYFAATGRETHGRRAHHAGAIEESTPMAVNR